MHNALRNSMGNIFSAGAVTKIEVAVRCDDKTTLFNDLNMGAGENKQMADLMLLLSGGSCEVVYFKLAQDDKHVYVPSEEKLIGLIEKIDAFKLEKRKGWQTAPAEGEAAPPEKTHIRMLMIDVKLDDRKKDLAAKMLLFHLALIMSRFDMECDDVCLMGGMCEFKALFGQLNTMVGLLK